MIRKLFTDIADVYDRMNHVLSLGMDLHWRKVAVETIRETPPRILDLACGTGDLTFALARRFPDAEITGIDITPAMLELARRKNSSPRIAFIEGNAQTLSFTCAHPFSLVSCAFGFRNFPDKPAALAEARHVIAADGKLLVLEFFRPDVRLLGILTSLWIKMLAAIFASRNREGYAHLRQSMLTTVSATEFIALAEAAGFRLDKRKALLPCCTCLLFSVAETAPPIACS